MANNPSGDLSWDARKVRDAGSMFNGKKTNPMVKVGKVNPQTGADNATFGSSGGSGWIGFGPGSAGSKSKKSGADYSTGPTKTGQDD